MGKGILKLMFLFPPSFRRQTLSVCPVHSKILRAVWISWMSGLSETGLARLYLLYLGFWAIRRTLIFSCLCMSHSFGAIIMKLSILLCCDYFEKSQLWEHWLLTGSERHILVCKFVSWVKQLCNFFWPFPLKLTTATLSCLHLKDEKTKIKAHFYN